MEACFGWIGLCYSDLAIRNQVKQRTFKRPDGHVDLWGLKGGDDYVPPTYYRSFPNLFSTQCPKQGRCGSSSVCAFLALTKKLCDRFYLQCLKKVVLLSDPCLLSWGHGIKGSEGSYFVSLSGDLKKVSPSAVT
jgi:hypothetical protein